MEIIGRLTQKFDAVQVSDKFKRREFVLTIEEQTPYPQELIIQLAQANCEKLDPFDVDDEIKVQFNLRGRKWDGPNGTKWFNTVDAWRVELVAKGSGVKAATAQPLVAAPSTGTASAPQTTQNADGEDLPF